MFKYAVIIPVLITLLFTPLAMYAQTTVRPSVGVTLSGGGAKGLAHIGILKAIDSAGIKPSYVTGTSMGSIVGALYASGYSGNEIENIARKIDWDSLLTNSSSLRSLIMEEKDEYNKYPIELPWQNKNFRLSSGVIESQELWLKLSELFFPVYNIKDFSKLPKSFECIATDISTGEMVVLNKGELLYAIRSSMAIPSVFTAVDYDNKKLVDGGLVRNFPVTNAKELGANYVIGSDVSSGLLKKEKIKNPLNVLLQIAFFREDEDAKKEKKLCNLYIHHSLSSFNTGSFSSSKDIIDSGVAKGNEIYPYLKHFADSLTVLYGIDTTVVKPLPKVSSVKIIDYTINGLNQTKKDFFLHRMQFKNNAWYNADELNAKVRNAFGTRYYNKIIYSLEALSDSSARITFNVDENPLTFAKFGINYNSFQGISIISNFTARNFITNYSRSMVDVSINYGDNMRIKAEHLQFLGKSKSFTVKAAIQAERINFDTYSNFKKSGVYKRAYFLADIPISFPFKRKMSIGGGAKFETFGYEPQIVTSLSIKGNNSLFSTYLMYKFNTLNNNIYPKSGVKLNLETGFTTNQSASLKFYNNGQPIPNFIDSAKISFKNFCYVNLNTVYYIPIADKYTLQGNIQAGINFNQQDNSVNNYFIGGLMHTFRGQITFAGLAEGAVMSGNVAAVNITLRKQLGINLYLNGGISYGMYDFLHSNNNSTKNSFLSGYALTLGYNTALGPLDISIMYSDQSKNILPYISFGVPF